RSARSRANSTQCSARSPTSTKKRSTTPSPACRNCSNRPSWSSSASSSAASWSQCTCRSSSSAASSEHSFSCHYRGGHDRPGRHPMTDFLHDPTILVTLCALLGLFIGSFLNVVIHRLPRMMEHEWRAQAAELRGEEDLDTGRYNLAVPR